MTIAPDPTPTQGIDVSFWAKLGAHLQVISGVAQRAEKQWQRRLDAIPADQPQTGVVTIDSGGDDGFIDLGSPPLGYMWHVRRVIVGGVKVTSTAAGKAYLFATGAQPTALQTVDVGDIASLPMPQPAFYGTHQFVITRAMHLWCVIHGGTANTQYVCSATVEQWRVTDQVQSSFTE